jgi:hypothetical protein
LSQNRVGVPEQVCKTLVTLVTLVTLAVVVFSVGCGDDDSGDVDAAVVIDAAVNAPDAAAGTDAPAGVDAAAVDGAVVDAAGVDAAAPADAAAVDAAAPADASDVDAIPATTSRSTTGRRRRSIFRWVRSTHMSGARRSCTPTSRRASRCRR